MSKSDIVFQIEYKKSKNKRIGITKWLGYASQKNKADSLSLDEYDLLKDYAFYTDKDSFLSENSESFIWNKDGDISKNEVVNEIKNYNQAGIFWRGFLSFPPDFATVHGLITKSDFYSLTNNVMPSLVMDMGLDLTNVEWLCALHRDTKHPHIHFCIFEKTPTKSSPTVPLYCIRNFKSNVANFLIDYTAFYELRDKAFSDITKNISLAELNKIKSQRLFSDSYRKGLNNLLTDLYNNLPEKGRLQYNSKNMLPYKKQLDNLIEYILLHNSVKYDYAKYLRLLETHQHELNQLYGMSDSNKSRKYYNEQLNRLYSKIGNEILNNYKVYHSMDVMAREKEFLSKHIREMQFISRNDYAKEETKRNIASDLYRVCLLVGLNDKQAKKVLSSWIKRSHYNFSTEDIKLGLTSKEDISSTELYSILKKVGYDYERYNKLKRKYFYRELNYKRFINQAVEHLMYELDKEQKQIINDLQYDLDDYK